jgi:hypothetical protein
VEGGCKYPSFQIAGMGAHTCSKCGKPVHNFCCRDNLGNEEPPLYCSLACMGKK